MAITVETLEINVEANTSRAQRALKGLDGQLDKTGGRANGLASTLGKGALIGALIGLGVALVRTGRQFSNFARDAEEVQNQVNAVFRDQSAEVRSWARTYSDNLGLSTTETLEFAASLQDTFVPLGIARDEATNLSQSLVELAGDVGSFKNVARGDVVRDFQSALVGNTETVRKYGIVITQAVLQQEAVNAGLGDNLDALTEAQKAQLRYNIILAGTADAQGDLANTLDSTANTQRRLKSSWRDLGETLGGVINNVLTPLTGALNVAIVAIDEFLERVTGEAEANRIAETSLESLQNQYEKLGDAIENLNEEIDSLGPVELGARGLSADARRAVELNERLNELEAQRAATLAEIQRRQQEARDLQEEQVQLANQEQDDAIQELINGITVLNQLREQGLISESERIQGIIDLRQKEIDRLRETATEEGNLGAETANRIQRQQDTIDRLTFSLSALDTVQQEWNLNADTGWRAADEAAAAYNETVQESVDITEDLKRSQDDLNNSFEAIASSGLGIIKDLSQALSSGEEAYEALGNAAVSAATAALDAIAEQALAQAGFAGAQAIAAAAGGDFVKAGAFATAAGKFAAIAGGAAFASGALAGSLQQDEGTGAFDDVPEDPAPAGDKPKTEVVLVINERELGRAVTDIQDRGLSRTNARTVVA